MWLNPQETADLVTLTEEILHGKLHFLHSKCEVQRRIQNPAKHLRWTIFDRVVNVPLRSSTSLPSPKIKIVFSKSQGISFRKE